MGKSKQDTKSADKGTGGKGGKGKGKADSDEKDSKAGKGAQSINVRHILVRILFTIATWLTGEIDWRNRLTLLQCEKHAKKEEALAKIQAGAKFDEVAREFSEDKARQGERVFMKYTSMTD